VPLIDHFRPPLHPQRSWEAFHSRWANALADALNDRLLPRDFFAEAQGSFGARVEIDVATYEGERPGSGRGVDGNGATAVATEVWAPPAPAGVLDTVFPPAFEVRVFGTARGGLNLVAAIELVSPGNKDRPEERRAFAIKCGCYLHQGTSLIVVDIVTTLRANLHNELLALLGHSELLPLSGEPFLYGVAYRPIRREEKEQIDVWPSTFGVGGALPELPLGLTRGLCVPVNFEAAYVDACRHLRLI
jgi:hypothetical protein